MVAETRNHLFAAAQNISSAHGNLKPVTVPYCTHEDLQVSLYEFCFQCMWLNEKFQLLIFCKVAKIWILENHLKTAKCERMFEWMAWCKTDVSESFSEEIVFSSKVPEFFWKEQQKKKKILVVPPRGIHCTCFNILSSFCSK